MPSKVVKYPVEYRGLGELKKLEHNPRTITKEAMERLKKSIKDNEDYFEARPIILFNRTGELVILAGNQRYEAAKALGIDQVPTVLLEGLTEERECEIVIRDNVELGDWDFDILANEWDVDALLDWGGDELVPPTASGLVEQLKQADFVEKENYFIKKPFVLVFYDDKTKDKLAGLLGVEKLEDDVYDVATL